MFGAYLSEVLLPMRPRPKRLGHLRFHHLPITAAGRAAEEISLRACISFAIIVYIFERYDAKVQYKMLLIASAVCVLTRRNELLDRVLEDGRVRGLHSHTHSVEFLVAHDRS